MKWGSGKSEDRAEKSSPLEGSEHFNTLPRYFCLAGVIAILLLMGVLTYILDAARPALTVSLPLKNSEAVVLLAGSYKERAPVVAALYRAGFAKQIILTNDGVRQGWSKEHQRNLYAIERSEIDLIKQGVPQQAIVKLPFKKSGTVFDALAARDYLSKHNINSILLVTSDYHTRRSLWIFRHLLRPLSVNIGVVPAQSQAALFPDIALEYIKLVYYQLRFGLMDFSNG